MATCGEVLVKLLEGYGVEQVFGIPGVHERGQTARPLFRAGAGQPRVARPFRRVLAGRRLARHQPGGAPDVGQQSGEVAAVKQDNRATLVFVPSKQATTTAEVKP